MSERVESWVMRAFGALGASHAWARTMSNRTWLRARGWWEDAHGHRRASVGFEVAPKDGAAVKLLVGSRGSDDDVLVHVGLGVGVYVMASSRALRRLADALLRGAPQYEDREVRLAVHDGLVCWDLWVRPHCWSSGTPRWRQGSVNLADAVLGPARYEREVVGETRVVVPMPEGGYRGRVVHDVSRWTRPRWPWPKVVVGGTLEMDEPVPVPGKGENGYDLDEDAIHSLSFAGNMASDAVGRMVGSALRTRERREGLGWVPEGGPHGTGGRKSDEAPLEAG